MQEGDGKKHSYRVEVSIDGLKAEHVGQALRRLNAAAVSMVGEGLDVQIMQSVERDRDGIERFVEFIDDDGRILDRQPWEEGEE